MGGGTGTPDPRTPGPSLGLWRQWDTLLVCWHNALSINTIMLASLLVRARQRSESGSSSPHAPQVLGQFLRRAALNGAPLQWRLTSAQVRPGIPDSRLSWQLSSMTMPNAMQAAGNDSRSASVAMLRATAGSCWAARPI